MCACFAIVITSSGAELPGYYDATATLRVIRLKAHDLSGTTPLVYGHVLKVAHLCSYHKDDDSRRQSASGVRTLYRRGRNTMQHNPLAPAAEMHRAFDRRGADEESGDPTSLPDAAEIPQAATSSF